VREGPSPQTSAPKMEPPGERSPCRAAAAPRAAPVSGHCRKPIQEGARVAGKGQNNWGVPSGLDEVTPSHTPAQRTLQPTSLSIPVFQHQLWQPTEHPKHREQPPALPSTIYRSSEFLIQINPHQACGLLHESFHTQTVKKKIQRTIQHSFYIEHKVKLHKRSHKPDGLLPALHN